MPVPRRSTGRQVAILAVGLAATGYFSVHAVQGRHGLSARRAMIERATLLGNEMARLELVKARLATDVAALQREPMDDDFVETLAAELFGYVRPGDRIIVGSPPRR